MRKQKNPAYSLRAFARDLGISRTAISDVVRGSRRLSVHNIEHIAKVLQLDSETVESLKDDLQQVLEPERIILESEELDFVEDWHYLGILSLAKLSQTEYSADWVAKKLGLQVEVAQSALNFLSAKGYIENMAGKLVRKATPLTTTVDIPSSSIVESHRQSLQKAIEALEEVDVTKRDFTAVTYAIDPEQLPEVKEHILKFHRRLGKLLSTQSASEVYRLNIQFFPLTR
nr:TIGR02147 family protein [Bacteriovorax sp. HI3]